jgi:L-fuculose-phosphate aldolase
MIAVGATLEDALALAVDVEYLAEVYWRILQAGNPTVLEESEMDRVLARFATYGQHPSQDRDG